MAKPDGGPAFPQMLSRLEYDKDADIKRTMIDSTGGMSLRDYFAAQALLLLAWEERNNSVDPMPAATIAGHAYGITDAMLKAREQ